jgi:uncharacterized protein
MIKIWFSIISKSIILSLISLPIFVFVAHGGTSKNNAYIKLRFPRSGVTVQAEVADSPDKRAQGLMFRRSLGDKEAMVFYFDQNAYQDFWMYNTLIPLTIIFLDSQKKIVDIQDMQPCLGHNPDLCMTYRSYQPATYAIEVNIGFSKKYDIKTGHQVIFEEYK